MKSQACWQRHWQCLIRESYKLWMNGSLSWQFSISIGSFTSSEWSGPMRVDSSSNLLAVSKEVSSSIQNCLVSLFFKSATKDTSDSLMPSPWMVKRFWRTGYQSGVKDVAVEYMEEYLRGHFHILEVSQVRAVIPRWNKTIQLKIGNKRKRGTLHSTNGWGN